MRLRKAHGIWPETAAIPEVPTLDAPASIASVTTDIPQAFYLPPLSPVEATVETVDAETLAIAARNAALREAHRKRQAIVNWVALGLGGLFLWRLLR